MNEAVMFWLAVAVILGVIEAATVNLVTVWSAIAAVLAAVLASLGVSGYIQFSAFVVLTGILLIATRPVAKKIIKEKAVPTNADRVIGAVGTVVEEIDPMENKGQIKVLGQLWSAKPKCENVIPVGAKVKVVMLEGVKTVVIPEKESVETRNEGNKKTAV